MDYKTISEAVEPKTKSQIEEFSQNGVLIKKNFFPHDLLDAYTNEREKLLLGTDYYYSGWPHPIPYHDCKTMLDLATFAPLTELIEKCIGDPPGLHLCLTGFKSTEREFHSDSYLNPEGVDDHYIAAWIALEDINPNSGPFQYVNASHKWPVIRRNKVWEVELKRTGRIDSSRWPSDTQEWVGMACENEIKKREETIIDYVPQKGDLLLWHSFLIHRGSKPINPMLERRALICHYSSIFHRKDMPGVKKNATDRSNGFYFNFR